MLEAGAGNVGTPNATAPSKARSISPSPRQPLPSPMESMRRWRFYRTNRTKDLVNARSSGFIARTTPLYAAKDRGKIILSSQTLRFKDG
jgi:hypothetical protein